MNLIGRIFVRTTRYRDTHNTFYRVVDQKNDGLTVQMIEAKVIKGDMWHGAEVPMDELREDQKPILAVPRKNPEGKTTFWIRPFKQWRDTEPIYLHEDGKEYSFTNYE